VLTTSQFMRMLGLPSSRLLRVVVGSRCRSEEDITFTSLDIGLLAAVLESKSTDISGRALVRPARFLRTSGVRLLQKLDIVEHRQVQAYDDGADASTHEQNDQRLEDRGETVDGRVHLVVVERGDLIKHVVEGT